MIFSSKIDISEITDAEQIPAHAEKGTCKTDSVNDIRKDTEELLRAGLYFFRHK